jgi:putative ABC transport system permease protein
MDTSLQIISLYRLLFAAIPAVVVVLILFRWTDKGKTAVWATLRMTVQLIMIGYVLHFIFDTKKPLIVTAVLSVMIITASWISTRTMPERTWRVFSIALVSIGIGGGATFLLVLFGVFQLNPLAHPRVAVPIAGMIFANAMNAISLAADRLHTELASGKEYIPARNTAVNTALIPVINSLLAVGLVSLPGMMTGQILSGVSPLIAVRYQIMVMLMIFGASGLSTIMYLAAINPTRVRNSVNTR